VKFRQLAFVAVVAALPLAVTVFAAPGRAQAPKPTAPAAAAKAPPPPPRLPGGKLDFSGFWDGPVGKNRLPWLQLFSADKMAPLKPGGEPLYEMHNGDPRHDEPRDFCMPSGFPWGFLEPFPIQMVQTSKYLVMIHEFQRMTRVIPLDGRPHSTEVEPSYQGDSVGHWEGDVLVIDTTNFKRWILDSYHYTDPTKNRMHSDALHTIERMRRTDLNTIVWQITIDDPKIFSAPWSEAFVMKYHPEWEANGLYEYVCQENNRCPSGSCK
jgi:hypothetical protein